MFSIISNFSRGRRPRVLKSKKGFGDKRRRQENWFFIPKLVNLLTYAWNVNYFPTLPRLSAFLEKLPDHSAISEKLRENFPIFEQNFHVSHKKDSKFSAASGRNHFRFLEKPSFLHKSFYIYSNFLQILLLFSFFEAWTGMKTQKHVYNVKIS